MHGEVDDAGITGGLFVVVRCKSDITSYKRATAYLPDVLHRLLILQETTPPYEPLAISAGFACARPLYLGLDVLDRPANVGLNLE